MQRPKLIYFLNKAKLIYKVCWCQRIGERAQSCSELLRAEGHFDHNVFQEHLWQVESDQFAATFNLAGLNRLLDSLGGSMYMYIIHKQ